ncbi:MAG: glycosyltransferase family 4 protein [Eubacteriales bacterium]
MKTVLNIISDSNIGGAGRVLTNYLTHNDNKTYRTAIALPKGSALMPELAPFDCEVYEIDGLQNRSYHRNDVKTITDLLKSHPPDLVHTHGALSGRIAAKRVGIPVVFTRHSVFPTSPKMKIPPVRWFNGALNLHYSDAIIAVSPAAAQNLIESGVPKDRITIVMNGVAPLTKSSTEQTEALKKTLNIPPNTTVFGIFARLEPYKGHSLLLQAMEELQSRGGQAHLLIAGAGECEADLRDEIQRRNLTKYVSLLGFRKDVPDLLSLVDVQLNTSYGTEATSMALLEGMSLSIPSIVSDFGGNPYLIDQNGLIFPSRDHMALATAMETLIQNPEKRIQMGNRALEKYNAEFTAEIFVKNTQRVYHDLLKGN